MNLLNKACCLDPRFKSLSFLTVEEKEVVIDSVFDEKLVTNLTISGSTICPTDSKCSGQCKRIFSILIKAGVPQGTIDHQCFLTCMFNIYHYRFVIVSLSVMLMTTLLKVVPSRESCKLAAEEINSDLDAIVCWRKRWHIEYEPAKSSSLCNH